MSSKNITNFREIDDGSGDEMRDALLSGEMGGSVGSAPAFFSIFRGSNPDILEKSVNGHHTNISTFRHVFSFFCTCERVKLSFLNIYVYCLLTF
jgi:hypothetical protein